MRSGQPTRLALFLLHARGEFVPVARLIDRLWDGAPPRGASSTLHSHARALRSALAGAGAGGADLLVSERGRGYRLRLSAAGPGGAATDEDEFRALLDVGDRAVAAGDEDASIDSYRAALALWRGDEPYPELSADLDVEPHRAELVGLRDRGMRRLGDLLLASGRLDTAIPLFEAERAQRPTDQAVTARLMRAYAAAGDPQRATALYAELVRLLRDEHDDRPVRELAELDGRILRGDPTVVGLAEPRSLDRPASARALAVRSATVQDGAPRLARRTVSLGGALAAELTALVGRQREIDDAVAALGPGRLVTLYGPAGAGKSRLAREVARRLAGSGTEVRRAQLVDCDPDDLAGVLERVAEAFGVTAAVESSLVRAVAERVGGVDSLLVIDNCETVLERVALLTMRLLESCPTLSVVVTSREALHLPGERAVVIEPLPVDVEIARALALGAGADVLVRPRTAAVGELSPAGQLLAQRCLDAGWLPAGGAGSRLGAEERFDLEAIAALVDGLPLALEVLAPLAASHPLADLVERLGRGAGSVPADGSRSGAAGPLADVLGWAFDRLDQLERTVLFAAASFQTSCTAAGLVA
ncbi:MAG: winged helix-turn-helix domain-containing protein, partial [Acidimicrobiia bacterium]|nr:winged helix-turn-helix domain-containing protein [Acidimicrobiia bacterium]